MIEKKILENILGQKVYDNVLWEYDENLIQIISFKKDKKKTYNLTFNNLKEKYDLMVFISEDEKSYQGFCNCTLGKQGKPCEHLIWALIRINKDLQEDLKQQKEEATDDFKLDLLKDLAFFSHFKDEIYINLNIKEFGKEEVKLEIKANMNKIKEYKIINVEKFLLDIRQNKPLNYGKNFKTDSYTLLEKQESIFMTLDYINLNLKSQKKSINTGSVGYEMFLNLLKTYKNEYIQILDEEYFVSDQINDVNIFVKKSENDLIDLEFLKSQDYKILSQEIAINNKTKTIHILNEKDLKKLKLLNNISENTTKESYKENKYKVELSHAQTKEFKSEILPKIYNEFDINLDERLGFDVIVDRLKIKLECFKENKNICIQPHFLYGGIDTLDYKDNILIRRQKAKEHAVLKYLEELGYEYDPYDKKFVIKSKRSQYIFLTENLLDLKENYEVHIDDKLKNMILNFDSSSISVNIKKAQKVDYFELDFNMPNIKPKEVENILKAFEENKTFYTLEDDTFLKLNDKKLYDQLLFLKEVIKDNTYKLNTYRIPKYRAMQLEAEVKNKFNKYKMNQSFLNYVESIKVIKPIAQNKFKSKNYTLRDYQKKGVSWLSNLYDASLGALLADEMGLGKTIQTIAFFEIKNIKSALIVVPKALLYNWAQEFEKFAPDLNIKIVDGTKAKRDEIIKSIDSKDIVIATYNSLINDYKLYEFKEFDTVVIDEAQYIKNPTTKTTRCVKMLKAKFFLALTGTPIQNHLLEMWSIFDFILPGYYKDLNSFNKKYKSQEEITNLEILKDSSSPFILRRLKKDVLQELPDKVETNLICEMEDKQKVIYKEYNKKVQKEIDKYIKQNTYHKNNMQILSAITRLRQLSISPRLVTSEYKEDSGKIAMFEEIIKDIVQSGQKILVFSQYTSLLSLLKEKLETLNIKYYYLDGKTKPKNRLMDVEKFNKNNIPVYLISLKAGGVGLNLTSASNVLIMDPWWNPAVENQAIDRSHRIGQKQKVQVYKMISKGTIEEKILEVKQQKENVIKQVLQTKTADITKMGTKEIMNLLKI